MTLRFSYDANDATGGGRLPLATQASVEEYRERRLAAGLLCVSPPLSRKAETPADA